MMGPSEVLRELIKNAVLELAEEKGIEIQKDIEVEVERPKREEHGDWATNIALQCAKVFGEKPRDLALGIVSKLGANPYIEKAEVAGPGFINFTLSSKWIGELLSDAIKKGSDYGRLDLGKGRKVQVEFVSANPTGPLHVGHGRGAAVGDVCANILAFAGWNVQREYYINDAGLQMDLLGKSTQARYFEICGEPSRVPFPEDGYKGAYIYELAQQIVEKEGRRFLEEPPEESLPYFKDYACKVILDGIKKDLEDFGVNFDMWFSEKSLYEGDLVQKTLETLKKNGYAYDADGATWFKATAFSDDKDRVLIRSNGAPTYFMSDIVYHKNKFDRGFDMVIDVWGADHHGYIPRMKAAVQALGRSPEDLQILLIQFVNLLRGGKQVSMSTRSGEFVTLREVMDEVGVDAARYFFVMRRSDSHLDFDLDLAKSSTNENPVFYVQYAHARIHSIFREAKTRGVFLPENLEEVDFSLLTSPEELSLIRKISVFPEEIAKAAEELAPHRVTFYLYDVASVFHSFYNAHRVLGVEPELEKARLCLVEAARVVIANSLKLLGVSAPEKM
ncbi:arginyl-tRNA synthetase [Thermovirga lienii DSM 17291]|jgi:arginyl-tRNA synthetase|uniref:Arginine--tRNA ligase n=1 Tax=Thermovirga lienii (strain ATCC BAA-1197 / DSM 17291 / Cas60314) TaxID=580340 RepID=G7V670_THELD|nr:arginine--tRNA ligase [Thermovirga lienii]AER67057.1 arginyl-tRNA synthetase [Thermovirga lienii DSM 17291]MDN5318374.1 arginyl-tRNA synthetase [Thermovirga sp.]MDN5367663.1 arginyl-tRNA synthetase [Thermovirga sp.]